MKAKIRKYAIECNLVDKIEIPPALESYMIVKATAGNSVSFEYANISHAQRFKDKDAEHILVIKIDLKDDSIVAYVDVNKNCPNFSSFLTDLEDYGLIISYVNKWLDTNKEVLLSYTK